MRAKRAHDVAKRKVPKVGTLDTGSKGEKTSGPGETGVGVVYPKLEIFSLQKRRKGSRYIEEGINGCFW